MGRFFVLCSVLLFGANTCALTQLLSAYPVHCSCAVCASLLCAATKEGLAAWQAHADKP